METEGSVLTAPVINKDFLSIEDVAAYFGININTAWKWRQKNKLPPAYKFGKLVRWRKEDVDVWAEKHREDLTATPTLRLQYRHQALQKRSGL
jgi:excisionase family DNA binding protein